MVPGSSDNKVSAYNAGDPGSIPGLGRSPGEGNGNPLQYSCLENPMDQGAWWATIHGVAKRWTRLSSFTSLQLVVQWLEMCLAMQGTWVQFLLWEDPTCCRTAKPTSQNYWAHVPHPLKPAHPRASALKQEKPLRWEACRLQLEESLLTTTREKARTATKTAKK